jgi:hypothetical protein
MLERRAVKWSTRRRASQLAALLGAFAALRLRPPRLLAAAAEAVKQTEAPSLLRHLGPWDSVVLVWAMARLSGPAVFAAASAAAAAGSEAEAPVTAGTAGAGGGSGGASNGGLLAGGEAAALALVLERATTQVGRPSSQKADGACLWGRCASAGLAQPRPIPPKDHAPSPLAHPNPPNPRSASCRGTTSAAPTACSPPRAPPTRRCSPRCGARCGYA